MQPDFLCTKQAVGDDYGWSQAIAYHEVAISAVLLCHAVAQAKTVSHHKNI